ncbi:hypothetical protein THAOC_08497, partial [Thalassiosira oceanica]
LCSRLGEATSQIGWNDHTNLASAHSAKNVSQTRPLRSEDARGGAGSDTRRPCNAPQSPGTPAGNVTRYAALGLTRLGHDRLVPGSLHSSITPSLSSPLLVLTAFGRGLLQVLKLKSWGDTNNNQLKPRTTTAVASFSVKSEGHPLATQKESSWRMFTSSITEESSSSLPLWELSMITLVCRNYLDKEFQDFLNSNTI